MKHINPAVKNKAKKIKLLLTDCDGVLTDTGVYYSEQGEELKKFSIRDGMGVQRLKELAGIETGIITGEFSGSVKRRAEKLKIEDLYLGVEDKKSLIIDIAKRKKLNLVNIAYIGDDTNDVEVLKIAGLAACPADAVINVKQVCDVICENKGGNGAFREFAEIIINSINSNS